MKKEKKRRIYTIAKLGYMKESLCPASLECEAFKGIDTLNPIMVAALLVAGFECLSIGIKESREIEFEKETIKQFIKQMKHRYETADSFRYGSDNFPIE